MIDLHRGILEEFAAHAPQLDSLAGMNVTDPHRHTEQTAVWKALHPAQMQAQKARRIALRRERGISTKRGVPGRAIKDQYGVVYLSERDAATRTGTNKSNVHCVLKGTRKMTKGLVFSYV